MIYVYCFKKKSKLWTLGLIMLAAIYESEQSDTTDQSSVIAAFIKRFREAPPTAPDRRHAPKDKDAFWWVGRDHLRPGDLDGSTERRATSTGDDLRSALPVDIELATSLSGALEEDGIEHPTDISEGEVPRDHLPVRACESTGTTPSASSQHRLDAASARRVQEEVEELKRDNVLMTAAAATFPMPSREEPRQEQTRQPTFAAQSFLESAIKAEEDFEFEFGMDELDERTNMLLQKCEQVLGQFITKQEPHKQVVIAPSIHGTDNASNETSKPDFQATTAEVMASETSSRQCVRSPVRGFRTADDSIFSLTSVLSDDEEIAADTLQSAPVHENVQLHVNSDRYDETINIEKIELGPNKELELKESASAEPEGHMSPLLLMPPSAQTPPRRKQATNSRSRQILASPESVRSINGISMDKSGLFMFLSSSDEGAVDDHVSESNHVQAPATIDSELSRSSASYSEEYHKLISSLDGIEMLVARDKHKGADHPYDLMRASKEHFSKSKESLRKNEIASAAGAPNTLNAETIGPYMEDEIVSILWKRLSTIRAELRRRTEEEN